MSDATLLADLSLTGLSIGDAFGEQFFTDPKQVESLIERRVLRPGPWRWTDDTAMALAIVHELMVNGLIHPDSLAISFADGYRRDVVRGYGGTAHSILHSIGLGVPWRLAAQSAFNGDGSMGNGAAMRAGPIGAYFFDDYQRVIEQALLSAAPTHAHPDGQAGAVAVGVAAAYATRIGLGKESRSGARLLDLAAHHTPKGATLDGMVRAQSLPLTYDIRTAVSALGNGSGVVSSDTVPFALWCAARHLDSYEEALWATVSGLGDRDTTCAIVGSIVALAVGEANIPRVFAQSREPITWPIPHNAQAPELER